MNKISVLVLSCDSYSDVWGPFFTLFFRYWKCPYQVYVTAETEQCLIPEVKTINCDGPTWTDRIRAAVKQIDTEYVICMCEDFFFRKRVRQAVINGCLTFMDNNPLIACFNFEKNYDQIPESSYPGFGRKPNGSDYRKTCQAALWRKSILEELLNVEMDPWGWETSGATNEYEYYIWTGPEDKLVFEYGYHDHKWFGIQKGKWVAEDVGPLFKKEGISVNLSGRGTV